MRKRSNKVVLLFLGIGLLTDLAILYFITKTYPTYDMHGSMLIIAGHVLASVVASWGVYSFHEERYQIAPFVFVMTLTLPLLGFISVWQMLTARHEEGISELYTEYRNQIHSGAEKAFGSRKISRSMSTIQAGMELVPIAEALDGEREYTRKLALIKNLGKITDRTSVETLKNLLEDSHMDVRYYAGEELAHIEERYSVFINELKKNVSQNPANAAEHYALASTLMEYAFSGLLDESAQREELDNARSHLEKSLDLEPNQIDSHVLLGRLYIHFKQFDRAEKAFAEALELNEKHMDALMGLSECYWNQKKLPALHENIKKIEKHLWAYTGENKETIIEIIEGWRAFYEH